MSVKVTNKDIVLLGHGDYSVGWVNIILPENIDLYVLPPVRYTLMTAVAVALINQVEIKMLILKSGGRSTTTIDTPFVEYLGGSYAPDYALYELGSLSEWGAYTIKDKKNVITVPKKTFLSELIKSDFKIQEALKQLPKGEKLKLYWSACANMVSGYSASLP